MVSFSTVILICSVVEYAREGWDSGWVACLGIRDCCCETSVVGAESVKFKLSKVCADSGSRSRDAADGLGTCLPLELCVAAIDLGTCLPLG